MNRRAVPLARSAATDQVKPQDSARMETCCAVCTETLNFCAFGPCQHQEVCSRCMARLRLLDKNMNCAICREECPIIYVTRFMEEHTPRIPQDRWGTLKVRGLRCIQCDP